MEPIKKAKKPSWWWGCVVLIGVAILWACLWPAMVAIGCPMMADYYSANSAPIYPTAKLVDDHTGMYTGSGGIQYLYFYRSSAPLDEVVKYYDGKFGGAEKIYYDEHRKSTVYAYKTIKTARLAHTYCQVISFGEKGMPDVSVAIYSVDDPNGLNTEIYVVTDWLD